MCSPPLPASTHLGGPGMGAEMLRGRGHRHPGRTNPRRGDAACGMLQGERAPCSDKAGSGCRRGFGGW